MTIPSPHAILKHQIATVAFGDVPIARIGIWADHPGVALPEHLEGAVVLDIGFGCPRSIPDLVVDEAGIRCTLEFSGTGVFCELPWDAIVHISAPNHFAMDFAHYELDASDAPQQEPAKASALERGAKKGLRLV